LVLNYDILKVTDNETALLQGLAQDDKKAIETIYKENYTTIQSLIINNNGTADDAKDVFQEAMIVLYQKAKSGTFELQSQIKTYLYAVSRRIWLKRLLQQNKFLTSNDNHEELVIVDEDVEEHERRDVEFSMMEKAMNSLGEPCRSLLEAFYLQKRQMQDIASSFGYTNADNAKNQKYKCLMRLKKLFFTQYKTES
jgi:RNA polymerase sigma factor (sigma-70 family)